VLFEADLLLQLLQAFSDFFIGPGFFLRRVRAAWCGGQGFEGKLVWCGTWCGSFPSNPLILGPGRTMKTSGLLWAAAQALALLQPAACDEGPAGPPLPFDTAVTVDLAAPRPFEHYWKKSFGSGHASLTLRPDWQVSIGDHTFMYVTVCHRRFCIESGGRFVWVTLTPMPSAMATGRPT
jgi:hypothetical protein